MADGFVCGYKRAYKRLVKRSADEEAGEKTPASQPVKEGRRQAAFNDVDPATVRNMFLRTDTLGNAAYCLCDNVVLKLEKGYYINVIINGRSI